MELKRKIYSSLLEWKKNKGKTALLIEGARRVGKTFLIEKFAKEQYRSYILIDFGNVSNEIKDLFENESSDIPMFLTKLSFLYGKELVIRDTVFIFDEIQLFPRARQLIKYLVADGQYDYIETGSLLGLKQNIKSILLPSEEEKMEMHPLDFEEFLWAMEEQNTIPLLKKCYEKKQPLGQALHRKMMNLFRQYILVGGMPQSVSAYIETRNFVDSDRIKRNILNLYKNDIAKFAYGHESKVLSIFDELPSALSKHEKKFRLSSINTNARIRDYEDAFVWLKEAMIVNMCVNSTDPSIALNLNSDRTTMKLYMADTGLLVTHSIDEGNIIQNETYKALLLDRLGINEGMFMENYVAQALRKRTSSKLHFYSQYDEKGKIEIDFLIEKDRKICPLEVKSSGYKTHKSIDKLIGKFKHKIGQPYIIYTKDLKVEDQIVYLPIYMTMFL